MREARFAVRRPFLRMAAATAVATSGLLAASLAFADEPPAVNVVTIVDHQALDAFRDGAAEALKEAGYESGKTLDWTFQSAQGNTGTVAQIARKFVGSQPAAILAISTPAAQAVVAATKQIPVVYGADTDPVAAQLVKTRGPSGTNVTGVSDRLEPGRQVELTTDEPLERRVDGRDDHSAATPLAPVSASRSCAKLLAASSADVPDSTASTGTAST